MLDSMPMRQAPPSRTSRSSPNSSTTCCANVGLTRPNRFALGAAMPGTREGARRTTVHARPGGQATAARASGGASSGVGDADRARHDDGQWTGPELVHQASGDRRDAGREGSHIGPVVDMTISG
jgi:hypothetical protein